MEKKTIEIKTAAIILLSIVVVIMVVMITYLYVQNISLQKLIYEIYENEDLYYTDIEYVNKLDEEEEWIYSATINKVDNPDQNASTKFFIHELPVINIDSEDVNNINAEIHKLFEERNKPENINDFMYQYYENGNILSLLIIDKYAGVNNYKVYNIDLIDGTIMNNEAILENREITLEDLYLEVIELFSEEKYNIMENENMPEEVANELESQSINAFKQKEDKQLYVDEDGEIHAIAETFFPSGEPTVCDIDLYERIINYWE